MMKKSEVKDKTIFQKNDHQTAYRQPDNKV